jgi:hypothetical protein
MDPDAAYEEIVRLCAEIKENGDPDGDLVADLLELVIDLGRWLESGGFPPRKWAEMSAVPEWK